MSNYIERNRNCEFAFLWRLKGINKHITNKGVTAEYCINISPFLRIRLSIIPVMVTWILTQLKLLRVHTERYIAEKLLRHRACFKQKSYLIYLREFNRKGEL